MIAMDVIGRIRRWHSRRKKSEREIARMTGLSRNTPAKCRPGAVSFATARGLSFFASVGIARHLLGQGG